MPARSVVFAGDSKSLDPLNYRQMMGRAGRRGYDDIGHVIFFGISPRKISYLMTSQLTSLNGHYPIVSVTSSLRCSQLLTTGDEEGDGDDAEGEDSANNDFYVGLIKNLFHQPFNYRTGARALSAADIEKQYRYSMEWHVQNGFLSRENLAVDGLGDLAAVLHEYEPNNLLFAAMLQSGYLHRVCKGYTQLKGDHNSKLKKDILNKLMLILVTIFDRHPIPTAYTPPPSKSTKYMNSSYLVMPSEEELDKECLEFIDRFHYQFESHFYNLYCKLMEGKDSVIDLESMLIYEFWNLLSHQI